MRPSKRAPDQMRSVTLERNFSKHAEGSCLVKMGDTHVLCTASLEERVPPWLRGQAKGWVTAEYGMLPRATGSRMRREASAGKQSGRTQEIQRFRQVGGGQHHDQPIRNLQPVRVQPLQQLERKRTLDVQVRFGLGEGPDERCR